MYRCNNCGNISEFEEINVIKTYINQDNKEVSNIHNIDEFFYRENVICLECECTMEDEDVVEINE